jgi:hypothetical protein
MITFLYKESAQIEPSRSDVFYTQKVMRMWQRQEWHFSMNYKSLSILDQTPNHFLPLGLSF